jgi:ABC-type multidrug transport system fused ATPase/permease subunit
MKNPFRNRETGFFATSFRRSLALLSRRDRRVYLIMVGAQMATGLLDLTGVLLLGLVAVMATSSSQGNPIPSAVTDVAETVGLAGLDDPALLGVLSGIAALLLIMKSVVTLVLVRRVFRFLSERAATVSASLSSKFFSCSLLIVQSRPSQTVAYALGQGINAAVMTVLGATAILIAESTLLALLGVALLFINPVVTIAAGLYFGVIAYLLQRPLGNAFRRIGGTIAASDIAATTIVQEGINSYREVSVLDRRDYYRDNHRRQRAISAHAAGDMQFLGLVPKSSMEVALVVGALALAGFQFLTQDAITAVATLVVFLAAASRVMPAILRIQASLASLNNAGALAGRSYELAESLADVDVGDLTNEVASSLRERIAHGNPDFDPSLELTDVSVTYPGSPGPALFDASFSIPSGGSLALVGATGAGKSTLADLILGVLSPDQGTILIGGEPPKNAILRWAGGIAYVPQEVALGHTSVRENVALGLPREAIDDDLVWDALERAHLADFLRSSREGLDTLVGERGVRLSGGQRQRLGVARGLYTRPRLLVLDEATSALDAETENAIAETLSSLEGDVTTVTIAHRLATIRNADLVLYLEDGQVVARGSFAEVRAAVPRFNHQAELLGL